MIPSCCRRTCDQPAHRPTGDGYGVCADHDPVKPGHHDDYLLSVPFDDAEQPVVHYEPDRKVKAKILEKNLRLIHGDPMVDRALARIEALDVAQTRHGYRVACRVEFNDDRSASGAEAYWPEETCQCRYHKLNGICSHRIAVLIYKATHE